MEINKKTERGVLRIKERPSLCKLNLSSSTFSPEVLLDTVQASSSVRVVEQSSEEMPWWWAGLTFWWRTVSALVGWVRVTT